MPNAKNTANIREARFAGTFYTDNAKALEEEMSRYFAIEVNGKNGKSACPQALIVPHAGYVYSGEVAASAYRRIPVISKIQRVIILASSHRYTFSGASVYLGDYSTPFGKVETDKDLAAQLLHASPLFQQHKDAHYHEHSLEVQLPFLQYRLQNKFLLLPLILGTQTPDTCREIANVLSQWFTAENLFVISTDFSHYPGYNDAKRVDALTADAIIANDPAILLSTLEKNRSLKIPNLDTSLCGWTSILTLLYITNQQKFLFEKVKYMNSGDAKNYGDKSHVVGYWSIAVYNNERRFLISKEEKDEILKKARKSITTFVTTGEKNKISAPATNGILLEKTGVFVSIYIEGKLRGCIGSFSGERTLNQLLQEMAIAATRDCRFEAIKADELEDMELEISVLSPLKKINSEKEIIPGTHGIYIKNGFNSGTFLPQVATKNGWNVIDFLGHCSRDKAGLGWDGWKSADLFTYEAEVFRG
ncbi:MAG: AMMECR1 domain-containing protein [Draconibacterium sp.]|nr:MAG: AMMECR1 domain-containing protein [Draconibacterium sp.]